MSAGTKVDVVHHNINPAFRWKCPLCLYLLEAPWIEVIVNDSAVSLIRTHENCWEQLKFLVDTAIEAHAEQEGMIIH